MLLGIFFGWVLGDMFSRIREVIVEAQGSVTSILEDFPTLVVVSKPGQSRALLSWVRVVLEVL